MLIYDRDQNRTLRRVTLGLSSAEANELIEKLRYLEAHPEYHHDHVNDITHHIALDILIIEANPIESYDGDFQEALRQQNEGDD